MYILGLSDLRHSQAAALLSERGIEESNLSRTFAGDGVPVHAIRHCLESARIGWRDLEAVAIGSRPVRCWARQSGFRARRLLFDPLAGLYYQAKALGEVGRAFSNRRSLKAMKDAAGARVLGFEHHLCHAASAFYASPFDRAAILTLDERGDALAGMLAVGEGSRIRVLRTIPFPHSLAWVYGQVTDLIGFVSRQEEHKTQWLSLEGEPVFADLFLEMMRRGSQPLPRLDLSFFNRGLASRVAFSKKFYERLGVKSPKQIEENEVLRRQLASSIQQACATLAAEMAEWLRRETGAKHLCLAGGLFWNAPLVSELEKRTGYERVFVQPVAGNAGTALGAAWLAWHQLPGQPRQEHVSHLYWGPRYSSHEVKPVLDNCKLRYQWFNGEEEKLAEAVRLLDAGKTVAWFQGATEFGPRALGNRSLLASPWAPYIKENLNEYVKHREAFRPFAVAVPEEDAVRYFDTSMNARFLASLSVVRPDARELLREFLLSGDRIRVQVVERSANPLFWRLLKCFGEHNPARLLVNSSFNLFGEPLVVTPREAVRSLFCSGIDALVMENFLVTKSWQVRLVVDTPAVVAAEPSGG